MPLSDRTVVIVVVETDKELECIELMVVVLVVMKVVPNRKSASLHQSVSCIKKERKKEKRREKREKFFFTILLKLSTSSTINLLIPSIDSSVSNPKSNFLSHVGSSAGSCQTER